MADVEIVVEASLGDSLAKLGLAREAVDELGNSSGTTSGKVSRFNRSMDDSTIASARAGESILKTDSLIRDAENTINDVTMALESGGSSGGGFIGALTSMNASLGPSVPLLFGLTVPLAALPVVAVAAAVAVVALADTLGTLVAIVADLIAPVTLVGGLLGGLAIAFGYVAQHAISAASAAGSQRDALLQLHAAQQTYNQDLQKYGEKATQTEHALVALHSAQQKYNEAVLGSSLGLDNVKHHFDALVNTLTHDFSPLLIQLTGGLDQFLVYLDRVAHMPLGEAFRSLSQRGVQMVNQFVEAVAHVVSKPIRLAFQIAFGTGKGGNEFASAVSNWWHQFSDFLFGYTQTHRLNVPLEHQFAPLSRSHVDGIFQPLIDWFNRHHFTRQGIEIGHDMLGGVLAMVKAHTGDIARFLITILVDAGKTAGIETGRLIAEGINHGLLALDAALLRLWNGFVTDATRAAQSAWNAIESIFSHAVTLIVNVVPHFLGALSLGSGSVQAPGGGKVPGRAVGGHAPGANSANIHIHFNNPTITSHADAQRLGAATARVLASRARVQAGI